MFAGVRRRPVPTDASYYNEASTSYNGDAVESHASYAPNRRTEKMENTFIGLQLDDDEVVRRLRRCACTRKTALLCLLPLVLPLLFLASVAFSTRFDPQFYVLRPPMPLVGRMQSNALLLQAEKMVAGELRGSESILVEDDIIYATSLDGRILKIRGGLVIEAMYLREECNENTPSACGHLTSIRRLDQNLLLVVDGKFGLYSVDFDNRKSTLILGPGTEVDRVPILYLHDVAVVDENRIVLTERSGRHPVNHREYDRFEHQPSGRLLYMERPFSSSRVSVLTQGLFEPTGVEVLPDKDTVLFSETGTGAIVSFSLSTRRLSLWSQYLPGLPGMIRLTHDKENVWVGMDETRMMESRSTLSLPEKLMRYPLVRKALLTALPIDSLRSMYLNWLPRHAIAVKLDLRGKPVISIQGPTGFAAIGKVAQVMENESHVFAVSPHAFFIGRIDKNRIMRLPR